MTQDNNPRLSHSDAQRRKLAALEKLVDNLYVSAWHQQKNLPRIAESLESLAQQQAAQTQALQAIAQSLARLEQLHASPVNSLHGLRLLVDSSSPLD